MRAVFVDANDTLAAVTERLAQNKAPAIVINRNADITPGDLVSLLADADVAIIDHTYLPTDLAKQCSKLKHVVFLGTGARSYMNPEELAGIGIAVQLAENRRRRADGKDAWPDRLRRHRRGSRTDCAG